ncbi:unnamed protein product [Oppiella nova]|uniref:Cytochrome P450 n=1 Tax=Oppiella nova TaxID=334625 RepID=A0A7R9LCX7_9ACAR|nr:unnamed protein product [Oppiella nova]CAG2162360.1 unnamed protein product [Oppiella nova]
MIGLFGFSLFNLAVGFLTSLPLIYWFLTKNNNYWKKLGVKGPKPIPIFGNFLERCQNPVPLLDVEYVKKYGNIFGIFNGRDPTLMVAEPELLKQILVKEFHKFSNRRELRTEHPIINKNLFNSMGEDWKRMRTIMSPTFSSGKLRKMYHLVEQCLEEYLGHLDVMARDGKYINAKLLHQNFTFDVIAKCAFATKTNSQKDPNNKLVAAGRKVFIFSAIKMIPAFIFPKFLNKMLNIRTNLVEAPNEFIFDLTRHMLKKRRDGEKSNDFLQLLIDANAADNNNNNNNNNNKDLSADKIDSHHFIEGEDEIEAAKQTFNTNFANKTLTEDEIIAQSWLFLLAGFETTATTLGHLSYELGLNPDVQEKLHNEVINAFDLDGKINYETLQSLPYLDAVISETLRMYPALARLEREAGEDVKLGDTGITVFKGQLIEIPVYAIHRSERYYKNADTFTPERFMPENRKDLVPYAYMPFGTGPRNCIGMRFALMEIKLCIAHIVKRFRFTKCADTEMPIKFMNLTPLMTAESF